MNTLDIAPDKVQQLNMRCRSGIYEPRIHDIQMSSHLVTDQPAASDCTSHSHPAAERPAS